MLLRARFIYPVSAPPIEDGFIRVKGEIISEMGAWSDCKDQDGVEDLGEVILMPGLVNAHCHLDYTDFAGKIPPPDSFTQWLKEMVSLKADVENSTHCESWLTGSQQAVAHGITTLGNIESQRNLLPELWAATPLRIISFIELILLKAENDAAQVVDELRCWLSAYRPPRGKIAISPHAPYTTKLELLRECARLSGVPVAMHVAESAEEDDMFRNGEGAMWQMLQSAGRDMSDCWDSSPLDGVNAAGLLNDRMLLVHGNYLNSKDIVKIADSQVSVVHCPRSHEYFGHRSFPAKDFRDAGVNLCLGTDSLATMSDAGAQLELFSEMQQFRHQNPDFSNEDLVRMVAVNAARALGMQGQVGCLRTGAYADLIALSYTGEIRKIEEAIVSHHGPVDSVMISGDWVRKFTEAA